VSNSYEHTIWPTRRGVPRHESVDHRDPLVPRPRHRNVLTEIFREGARRMIARAVEARATAYSPPRTTSWMRPVAARSFRNGHLHERRSRPACATIEASSRGSTTAGPGERRSHPRSPAPYLRRTGAWRSWYPGCT